MAKPIPVSECRRLARELGKSMIVVMGYDPSDQITSVATYGVEPKDKQIAADVGERVARLVGCDLEAGESYEDFRTADQAKRAAAIELLVQAAGGAHHAISSVLAVRDGISDGLLEDIRYALAKSIDVAIESGAPQPDPPLMREGLAGSDAPFPVRQFLKAAMLREWLETEFREACLDDDRVMAAAAAVEKGDQPLDVIRKTIADFVRQLIDPSND
jgi:hypothetical protein